ncbi:DUF3883 domain-containing protein [Anaerofustis sp. LCP19S3_F7]|uniref:DUF3883 domain-containing protein n=1 Tax=Anaerofustis sp. LCP19S3_F7 TaxID=3440247 RepID=UPI003F8F1A19
MDNIIQKIREMFISEAKFSPLLFNDLANMEKYISESYSGRSLIELLQNADDALSKRFFVKLFDKYTYIIANDGRPFNNEDILSLCRSGSSTKIRKNNNTIGFRGIGFKSVVNYAETVHLISGDIKATFSKVLTKGILNDVKDVPLIRIPHEFIEKKYDSEIKKIKENGYTTIFIFESKNNVLSKEIADFDINCMLFLNSVQNVNLFINNKKEYKVLRNRISNKFYNVRTFDNDNENNWLVTIPTEQNNHCSVAFKFDGIKAVEAETTESVVHSFMPTHNKLSMKIKVNGDFSTDPSRTRIVIDDETYKSAEMCADILVSLIIDIFEKNFDKYGIINIVRKAKMDPLSQIKGVDVNDIIVRKLKDKIIEYLYNKLANGKEIYLQPQGITNNDFERITKYLNIYGIGNIMQEQIHGLLFFLNVFGVKEMPLNKCLFAMKDIECSENTRTSVLIDAINKTRFGMDENLKENLKKAKLITFNLGVKPIVELKNSDIINQRFEESVISSLNTISDYNIFLKKIGLKQEQSSIFNDKLDLKKDHIISNTISETKVSFFSKKKVIKKWRSVEKNVAAVLELIDDIEYVSDVSTQNLGYDLEAVLKDGKRRFYEVKSVNNFGDTISITNNEFSTASQYKNNYYLAIACQNDKYIEICFVKDPINSLSLSKRVTRWEWICNEYEGEVIKTKMSI